MKTPIAKNDINAVRDASLPLLSGLASAILLVILFAWLSEQVFRGNLEQFDSRVRMMVHSFSTPQLTKVVQAITFLGSSGFLIVLFTIVTIIFLATGLRRSAIWLAIAMSGSVILELSLKLAFHRARPDPFFGLSPRSYSFPSGHALNSLCFYGVLAGLYSVRIKNRVARISIFIASGLLIVAIGFSRIYLGVHYPTDVIAGYLAGGIWISTLLVTALAQSRSRDKP